MFLWNSVNSFLCLFVCLAFFVRKANADTPTVIAAVKASIAFYNVGIRIPLKETVILSANRIPQSISCVLLDWVRPLIDWPTREDRPWHQGVIVHVTRIPWNHPVTMRPVLWLSF